MSYNLKILKDHPISLLELNDLTTPIQVINSYNDPGENYDSISFYNSSTLLTNTAIDKSGCGNNGTYEGDFPQNNNLLPLISGGINSTEITHSGSITVPIRNNYYGNTVNSAFGTKETSDNDFTLEIWISPNIIYPLENPIFADDQNKIGIYWKNGEFIFKVSDSEFVRYSVPYSKKTFHVVGTYSVSSITLYVDSIAVATKTLNNFKFTNESINLRVGPTTVEGDYFVANSVAAYRYSLDSNIIQRHYLDGSMSISPIHVAYPDKGILFSGTDANIRAVFDYSYPVDKSWTNFIDENTYYDTNQRCITFYKTETQEQKVFILNDSFLIPSSLNLVTSKIEWRNDTNITVESSTDGINYLFCENGKALPQYNKETFDSSDKVYIRITMITSDASQILPKLMFFCVTFYSNVDIYADNSGEKITSEDDYYLGSLNYSALSRTGTGGIKTKADGGFILNTSMEVNTLEFFYTPSSYNDSGLVSSTSTNGYTASKYSWHNSGIISKSNISKIYINGVNQTSKTQISDILALDQPHHIVIVYASPISGEITFNSSLYGSIEAQFKNIVIYEKLFTDTDAINHYNLYAGQPSLSITENAIALTEKDPIYYNNDWVIVQNV